MTMIMGGVGSAEIEGETPDQVVFDLINQYRAEPYTHATALGYDPMILADLGIFPETRFEPYVMDEGLCMVAADANAQAASPPTDPAPALSDRQQMIQTGAILAFSNFIPVETAAAFFVQNLLKNELDTGEFQYIFSSMFKHAGVAMDPGILDGRNTWFSTLVLGSPARISDIQLLNLVNQVRAEPALSTRYVSTDLLNLLQRNWQIYYLPHMQFQPIFFDESLYECATTDVLTPDSVDTVFSDPVNEYFQTSTVTASWENLAAADPVTDLFAALLLNELDTWPYRAMIFSNQYNKAGPFITVTAEPPWDTGEPPETLAQPGIGTATICAGSGLPNPNPAVSEAQIYGLVFMDHDDDTIYAVGEEMPGETVTVYDINRNLVSTVVTDNAGHFFVTLETGYYWFEAWKAEQFVRRYIYIESDHFVKMGFDPDPALSLP